MAWKGEVVCQVVGDDQRQEQIHTRERRRTEKPALQGRQGRCGDIPAQQSQEPHVRREGTYPWRKPLAELQSERQSRGRPERHIDREYHTARKSGARAMQADGAAV